MSLAVLAVFRCFNWAQNNVCLITDIYQAGPSAPSLSEDSLSQPAPQVLLDIYSEWSQVCVFEYCFVFLRDLFFTTETGARQAFLFCCQFIKHSLHSTFFFCASIVPGPKKSCLWENKWNKAHAEKACGSSSFATLLWIHFSCMY